MQRFSHTENVGFRNHQTFGAYNPTLRCGILSHPPIFTTASYPGWVWGSEVVDSLSSGWIVTELCEYEFISALSCHSSGTREFVIAIASPKA